MNNKKYKHTHTHTVLWAPTDREECSEFHCVNEKCVSWAQICDGVDNCGDNSDEMCCTGTTTQIHYNNTQYYTVPLFTTVLLCSVVLCNAVCYVVSFSVLCIVI